MKLPTVVGLTLLALISICPAQSGSTPADELDAKLQKLTDQQLVDCLREKPTACPLQDFDLALESISWELAQRKHPDFLITAYRDGDKLQRLYLVRALVQIKNRKVTDFMRSIAFENLPEGQDTEEVFFPLDYLARHCDQQALARLSRRVNFDQSFPIGCIYFAPTVEAFARCNYRPAAPSLVLALNAACVNIIDAAEDGLHKFFPHACKQAQSPDKEAKCYQALIESSLNNSQSRTPDP